ncbi:CCA tRNA nucleotidyltransferase [Faecalibacterium prausnitzii]|uniref:CCA tRNA nucleotidyltransferase n=1 Tax=Faecalibacterium prausnitzii TaxID=853 RepID=UPI00101EB511|nr:tRNA nucleotidyltransferase [Faecalibacterium prausnitzii]MSC66015.1 tRNA nucleotidyltransferase [Faecalibacterium prausnitzii]MSC72063.1 tRNA nucleotidyltransferase [Faecalibacterium prausnitzii]MSC97077.1 tRNA nucleotidyltransferase [Faecalibacterium prausnitzii]MSD37810.1 tRNA nucleotidyltransferase [Faecalibacterium prausnitzii]MSD51573.1 tRNA nucleotidyltransferase [Faecalibacterium prausnitzii]
MKLTLDPGAAALLDALHAAGYAAYAVGGCVRDSLLGRTAHDWDLCTSALPQQVMELFGTEQCIPTGLQHGTVTIKYGGQLYETTTFRTEGSYTDGRHPDEVQFVPDVREDLARRDFTINAMAYNAAEGLVDPFGGQADLQNGLLRAVGEPQQRFTEDALRILRLYRFAARFGFALDAATARAARQLAPHLDCISAERIQEELAKLLVAPQPGAYLEPAVLAVVLPELTPAALEAAKPVVDACPAGEENLPVRWAALLGTLGEADTRRVLKRLRCSNACIEETAVLVRETAEQGVCRSFSEDRPLGWDPAAAGSRAGDGMARLVSEEKASAHPGDIHIRQLLGRYGLCTVERLCALCAALRPQAAPACALAAQRARQLEADGVCCRVSQLAVNGRDLMAAGIPAGPALRRVLETLLDGVIRAEYPNEKPVLLAAAQKIIAS